MSRPNMLGCGDCGLFLEGVEAKRATIDVMGGGF